jgi:hypothetical protein
MLEKPVEKEFSLNNLKFIPGTSSRNDITLDMFTTIKKESVIEWAGKRDGESFVFKKTFLEREDGYGFTGAINEELKELYLLKTKVNSEISETEPFFLKGEGTSLKIKNDYFNFLLNLYYKDVDLFQFKLIKDGVWKFVKAEEEKVINIDTETYPFINILNNKSPQKLSDFIIED